MAIIGQFKVDTVGYPERVQEPELIPLPAGRARIYLAASSLHGAGDPGDEREVVSGKPHLDDLVDGLTSFAVQVTSKMAAAVTSVDRITLEFGCEVGVESGSLVAIIGKADTRSSIRVGLEWNRPERTVVPGSQT